MENTTALVQLQAKLKEIEDNMGDIRDDLKARISHFNDLEAEYRNLKGNAPFWEEPLTIEEPVALGGAAKNWGISREIQYILLSSQNVITTFTLDDLRGKLSESFDGASDATLHASIHYLKMNYTKYNLRPATVSLNALPTAYGIEYHANGKYTFYNYKNLEVTSGSL